MSYILSLEYRLTFFMGGDCFVNKEMDALVAESNVYKLLFENDRVRVLEAVFELGHCCENASSF